MHYFSIISPKSLNIDFVRCIFTMMATKIVCTCGHNTVNLEMIVRILFLRKTLKDIFAIFCEGFISAKLRFACAKFHEIKPL